MKTRTIFRVASRQKPYSMLGNDALRDERLSLEARGALCFILSWPEDWRFNLDWLMRETGIGRDKARRIVKDLEAHGYCKLTRVRNADGTLRDYEHLFTDEPSHLLKPAPENPSPASATAGVQVPGHPKPVNPPHTKKEETLIRKTNPLSPPQSGGEDFASPESGSEATGAAAMPRKIRRQRARLVIGEDQRQHFNCDRPHIGFVGGIVVTGAHAEQMLKTARALFDDTEPADIDDMLLKASAHFIKREHSNLANIVAWTAKKAALAVATAKYDRPESLCGGPIALTGGRELRTDWVCLSQARLDALLAQYPEVRNPPRYRDFDDWFWGEFCSAAGEVGTRRYGRGLQESLHEVITRRLTEEAHRIRHQNEAKNQHASAGG